MDDKWGAKGEGEQATLGRTMTRTGTSSNEDSQLEGEETTERIN